MLLGTPSFGGLLGNWAGTARGQGGFMDAVELHWRRGRPDGVTMDLIRLDDLKSYVFFWFFALSILVVVVSRLYGLGLTNTPVFATYVVFSLVLCGKIFSRTFRFNRVFFLAIGFFVFSLVSVFIQVDLNGSLVDRNLVDSYDNAVTNIVIGFVYFLFGVVLILPRAGNLSSHSFLLVSAVIIVLMSRGSGVVNYKELEFSAGIEVDQIQISQSIVVLVFLAFAYAKKNWRLLTFLLGAVALFFSGSRTAFVIGVLVMFCILVRLEKPQGGVLIGLLMALFASVALLFFDFSRDDAVSRMLFSGGLEADSSASSRMLQFLGGLEGLQEQILIGDFNYVVRRFDGVGWYMHNGLSFWQQYGAPVFLVFVMLLVEMLRVARRDFGDSEGRGEPAIVFRTVFLLYCLFAVFFSLAYTYKFFWFLVGMYCRTERFEEWRFRWHSF